MTVSCWVHMPICLPSGEQTDCPAAEQVPVDEDDEDDVEGVVEPDEELVIGEGAELGAAATAGGEAGTEGAAAAAAAIEGAAPAGGASDGATDGAAEPAAPDTPEDPLDPDAPDAPDAPDEPDDPLDPDAPVAADEPEAPDEPVDPAEPDAPDAPEGSDDPDAPVEPDAPEEPDEDDPAADALEFEPEDPDDPHLGPVGGVSWPLPNLSTEVPGSGNCTSAESTVVQSVGGMFALNMFGKDAESRSDSSGMAKVSLRLASRFLDPPLTLTDAQFMYISRLPILLNQVQAKVYGPGAIPCGMEKV